MGLKPETRIKIAKRLTDGFLYHLYQSWVSPNVRAVVFLVPLSGKKMFLGENRPPPKNVEN
jgi:hypothetical protein